LRPLRAAARRAVARASALLAPARGGLRILTYHRVNAVHPQDRLTVHPDHFAAQMDWLARCGRPVVALESALAALRGEAALAEGAVALTFDDGFADNETVARPILERFRFPATFFLSTAFVGTGSTLDRYRSCCADDRMLDWSQVAALLAGGHSVGGHGRAHLELDGLPLAEARAEVEGCARDLRAGTGRPPRLFCYPRGRASAAVRALVAEAGFEAACTVRPGANRAGADALALCRTEVSGDDDLEDFALKLAGAFDGWHRLRQGLAG
jgi:peptidoglycan/xylan/chitin deacetylase (PgdA/CDA1 family)